MYTITLHDGTEIKNLYLNGNSFISDTPLEESLFAGNREFADGAYLRPRHG